MQPVRDGNLAPAITHSRQESIVVKTKNESELTQRLTWMKFLINDMVDRQDSVGYAHGNEGSLCPIFAPDSSFDV